MRNSLNILKARVKARNAAHQYGNKIYAELVEIFCPLLGQKILKADGQLLAKIDKLLPDFPGEPAIHVYRHSSDYTLTWCVKVCEMIEGEDSCVYEEATVYVGDLGGDTLKGIFDPPDFRDDYTVEEIQEKRRIFEAKRKAFENARSDLYPFGEYDH